MSKLSKSENTKDVIHQSIVTSELKTKILSGIDLFKNKKVLILGDIGLDEYVLGSVRRISPEAPVPVLEVEEEDFRLGLSGNVSQNIASLGGSPLLVSVVGQDMSAVSLRELLKVAGVSPEYLVTDFERPTTKKTRVMAKHHHLVRVDYEIKKFLSREIEDQVIAQFSSLVGDSDIVIVEDYAKGVLSKRMFHRVLELSHEKKKKVLVDPHRTNPLDFYYGADLIKPNFEEALALIGLSYDDFQMHNKSISEIGELLRSTANAQHVVMTRGKEGMLAFSSEGYYSVPTYARQVFDVTGAGDTVIAGLALGLSSGFTLEESCVLANYAAGVVVGKVGCVPCTRRDLESYIQSHNAV
jgi:rfaE bifunctional protein kinase chain/domain